MSLLPLASDIDLTNLKAGDEAAALEAANAYARTICGWHVAPSLPETVRVNSSGDSRVLFLPSLYVTAVASVTLDDGTVVDPDTYSWDEVGTLIRKHCRWPCGTVDVAITHGYDTAPPDLRDAVAAMAVRGIDEAVNGKVASRQRGPFTEAYVNDPVGDDGLKESERAVLHAYRIPRSR